MDTLQKDKQQKLLEDCVNSLHMFTELVNEYCLDEQKETYVKQIKKLAKSYCEVDINNTKIDAALKLTKEHVNNSDNERIEDVKGIFKEKLEESVFGNIPMEEHKIMKKIEKALIDGRTAGCAGANNSLVASQSFYVPVDPITKKPIRTPWRNSVCQHVFECQTILEYIKLKPGKKVKCPYIGCTNVDLQQKDLHLDEELQKQISLRGNDESSFMDTTDIE